MSAIESVKTVCTRGEQSGLLWLCHCRWRWKSSILEPSGLAASGFQNAIADIDPVELRSQNDPFEIFGACLEGLPRSPLTSRLRHTGVLNTSIIG